MKYELIDIKERLKIEQIATLFYMEYDKDFIFSGEIHDFWEFVYCDYGEVSITCDEEEYLLKQGNIVFHKPNEFHSIKANNLISPNLVIGSFVCNSPDMKIFEDIKTELTNKEHDLLAQIIKDVDQCFDVVLVESSVCLSPVIKSDYFAGEQCVKNNLEIFLILLARRILTGEFKPLTSQVRTQTNVQSRYEDLVEDVKKYMADNLQEDINIDKICEHFFLSRSHLTYVFSKLTGKGAMRIFQEMKLKKCQELLKNTDYSITQISEMMGYSSIHYFSKLFKKETGMNPATYAKSIKIKSDKVKPDKVTII